MEKYTVQPYTGGDVAVSVPGSKSITNRALLLAALSDTVCTLHGVLFSDDSEAFLDCLASLGFSLSVDREKKTVTVRGENGKIPRSEGATINVRSAGTAARFLTVLLAVCGGEYLLESSAQMEKRPMEPLLSALRQAGVQIECRKTEGHFPFRLRSCGLQTEEISIDTEKSSQFASALLLCANKANDLTVHLTGNRTNGAYIGITTRMLSEFGVRFQKNGDGYTFAAGTPFGLPEYYVEPDVSAACYFYAAAAVTGRTALVRGVHKNSMQGDLQFLSVLQSMGCTVREEADGIAVTGTPHLRGADVDMQDFSDQVLTLSAIAPFAETPTHIRNVGHIRMQECDRLSAIVQNLTALGVKTEATQDSVTVYPAQTLKKAEIETFGDHRVAMSFTVTGMRSGNVTILDPLCCKKTFAEFFQVIDSLYR